MCGHDWCAVRISKEISLFVSGKEESYQWDKPKVSQALSAEQKEILELRGVLSAGEIHRLASKTGDLMGQEGRRAVCHSDLVDDEAAQHIQSSRLEPDASSVSKNPNATDPNATDSATQADDSAST
jgi:phosphomethylpyrimidine synthase